MFSIKQNIYLKLKYFKVKLKIKNIKITFLMPKNIEIHTSNGSHLCSNRTQKDNITLHNPITFLIIFPIFHSNSTDQYQKIRSNKTTCFGNII